jgi:hypothetical protein
LLPAIGKAINVVPSSSSEEATHTGSLERPWEEGSETLCFMNL